MYMLGMERFFPISTFMVPENRKIYTHIKISLQLHLAYLYKHQVAKNSLIFLYALKRLDFNFKF